MTVGVVWGLLVGVVSVCMGVGVAFWMFVLGREVSRRGLFVVAAMLFLAGVWVVASAVDLWGM